MSSEQQSGQSSAQTERWISAIYPIIALAAGRKPEGFLSRRLTMRGAWCGALQSGSGGVMRSFVSAALFLGVLGTAFGQGRPGPYWSLGGFGNVVYPGTGHAP